MLELDQPEETIRDAVNEHGIMSRLRECKARNVNRFFEGVPLQSLLLLVTEYCSGGNLSTMRRAMGGKYEEKYIRPIARELAIALRGVHAAGIVHRDVKCKLTVHLISQC